MIGLAPFFDLVKRRCGLSFEGERQSVLEAALAERMAATGLDSVGAYFTRLVGSAQEFDDLVSLLTINETYFFREAQQLTLMATRLAPRLLARPDRSQPIRILSAGCSTGEEPYSIAMTLRERYGDAVRQMFRVIGGDIDQRALARAREGRYSEFSFRGVAPDLKARYFQADGPLYSVLPSGRDIVEFMPLNLLDDLRPETHGRYDIIFLRNVTIYFEEAVRRSIQERLRTLLYDDGCLIIGMAETLANDFGLMTLVPEDGLFYFAHPTASGAAGMTPVPVVPAKRLAPPVLTAAPRAPVSPPRPVPVRTAAAPPVASFDEVLRLTWEKSYDRALVALDGLDDGTVGAVRDLRPLLIRAYILLNRRALSDAEAVTERVLAHDPWSIDALMLMGLTARHGDRPEVALSWFKRAVYASHACWPAHYYLADLHSAAGNGDLAKSAYRAALALLSSAAETGIKVLLPAFPASDIGFLCQHRLARLEGAPHPRPRT